MTVKTMLEKYPNAEFDFMSSCGYIYLTPKETKAVLAGEPTWGHAGCSGTSATITADELLTQEVYIGQWEGNVFHGLTDWVQSAGETEQVREFEESEGWKMGGIS